MGCLAIKQSKKRLLDNKPSENTDGPDSNSFNLVPLKPGKWRKENLLKGN